MAALSPHTRWVTLAFLADAGVQDPAGLLEGTTREQSAERRDAIGASSRLRHG